MTLHFCSGCCRADFAECELASRGKDCVFECVGRAKVEHDGAFGMSFELVSCKQCEQDVSWDDAAAVVNERDAVHVAVECNAQLCFFELDHLRAVVRVLFKAWFLFVVGEFVAVKANQCCVDGQVFDEFGNGYCCGAVAAGNDDVCFGDVFCVSKNGCQVCFENVFFNEASAACRGVLAEQWFELAEVFAGECVGSFGDCFDAVVVDGVVGCCDEKDISFA